MIRFEADTLRWGRDPQLPEVVVAVEPLASLYAGATRPGPLLPNYLRAAKRRPGCDFYVFERPPEERTIRYSTVGHPAGRTNQTTMFTLQLPWMVFVLKVQALVDGLRLGRVSVFCSAHALTGLSDPLLVPPLPNLYDTGRVCYSRATPDINNPTGGPAPTVGSIVNSVVGAFYDGTANADLGLSALPVASRPPVGPVHHVAVPAAWSAWLAAWQAMTLPQVLEWADPARYRNVGMGHNLSQAMIDRDDHLVGASARALETNLYTLATRRHLA